MVDEFVDVKNGRKQAVYLHPVLKEVLEETYGVMVFQEQVMRILNRLGGIELSRAYATIKAISKKKTEVIDQGRDQFLKGAVERGMDQDRAAKIFDLIVFFGGYGFNKSHSHRLCTRRLSDGLPEGPLPDRVHGGGALQRDGRPGAGQVLRRAYRGLPADGDRGAAAEHQRGAAHVPGGQRGADLTSGSGRSRGWVSRRSRRSSRPGRRGAVHQPRRLLRAGARPRRSAPAASRR